MNFVFQQQSFDPIHAALFTDLYELAMVQAYWAHRMNQPATFEIFFRTLPENRNFVLASGLEDVLAYLENLQFRDDDIAYLMAWCVCETTATIERQYAHLSPRDSPLTYPLDPAKMCQTSIPLHPGADAYYRDAKLIS